MSDPLVQTAASTAWFSDVDRAVDALYDEMVGVRRHLHANPEPSGQEHQTSMMLYQLLGDRGLKVQLGPEGRGVIAEPKADCKQPRIAVRADIDALRIEDQKEVPYRSQRPGLMHACGHDAHTGTAVGVALALAELEESGKLPWPVPWRAIFQPAEETATGAAEMVQAGVLDGVAAILATHMDPTREVGRIGMRGGVMTANCDAMRLTIRGRGGHAARPHESKDPIAAAAQLISTLYLFVPRATDSQDAVVVTIGQLIGGDIPNAIPERVELRGTLRTLDRSVRASSVEHIRQLARGIAEVSSTQIEVHFESGINSVVNDPRMNDLVRGAACATIGETSIEKISRPSMGSEDFAVYLQQIPGAMFRLGCASPAVGHSGLHTPTFDVDEQALAIGAKILAKAAILWAAPPAA